MARRTNASCKPRRIRPRLCSPGRVERSRRTSWTAIPSFDTFDRAICSRQIRTGTWPYRSYLLDSDDGWSGVTSRRLASCCDDTAGDGSFLAGCGACERSGSDNNRRWCTGSGRRCRSARRNIGSGSPSRATLNSKRNHTRRDESGSWGADKRTAVAGWNLGSTAATGW